mgnify:FL=1
MEREVESQERVTPLYHARLHAEGQSAIARAMRHPVVSERLQLVKDIIRDNYAPKGAANMLHLETKLGQTNDRKGLTAFLSAIDAICEQIQLMDPAKSPPPERLKAQLITGMSHPIFLADALRSEAMPDQTFEVMKKRYLGWISGHPELNCVSTVPLCDPVSNSSPSTTNSTSPPHALAINATSRESGAQATPTGGPMPIKCYNCGQSGHSSSECHSLRCGKCKKEYPSANAPGRHTSANCPQRGKGGNTANSSKQPTLSKRQFSQLVASIGKMSNSLDTSNPSRKKPKKK